MRVVEQGARKAPSLLEYFFQGLRGQRMAPETIKRREQPYWLERGWVRKGDTYIGNYQTRHGSFRALIEQRGADLRFFMFDPPQEVRQGTHWACFQDRGNNLYHVHMSQRPTDVSSGIITIERLIADAFEG
jgi:hypothetical protein